MSKFIALITAGVFAAGSVLAGSHGDCSKQVGNTGKMACEVSLASLNLTPEQKTKMDAVMAQHEKEGCTPESEAKYMREAKSILNRDQYAKFEAECQKGEQTQS
jgi:Spy/CpxP family protein refolding chaperone